MDDSGRADSVGTGAPADEFEIDPAVIRRGCEIMAENYMELRDHVKGAREQVVREIIYAAALAHPGLISRR